jgi:amino acid transporter
MMSGDERNTATRGLRVWDTVSIIIGIVIGTAIFRTTPLVFKPAGDPFWAIAIWIVGGGLSFCGALCYAELATAFPRNGGDYEYLTRAYGRWFGFAFGWAQLTVILSGSIGEMAYVFADYARGFLGDDTEHLVPWIAATVVLLLTAANLGGLVAGRWTQNILASVKVLGLVGLVCAGFLLASAHEVNEGAAATISSDAASARSGWMLMTSLGEALVFVMLAYGGWNDAAFVAAEVRQVERNLPRALFMGLGIVTATYVVVNLVYLRVLGYETASNSFTPAADVLQHAVGARGRDAISLLVMCSALGAINGLILAGSRVYAVFGQDNRALKFMGQWNVRAETPVFALVTQAGIAIVLILLVGTATGQSTIDRILLATIGVKVAWTEYYGGFSTLVASTAPTFWVFFLLTGISVFVLRTKTAPAAYRFRIPWYPLPAILFCGSCLFMLVNSVLYAKWLTLLGLTPLVLGIPLGFWHRKRHRTEESSWIDGNAS